MWIKVEEKDKEKRIKSLIQLKSDKINVKINRNEKIEIAEGTEENRGRKNHSGKDIGLMKPQL
jgi:hypothetical protein